MSDQGTIFNESVPANPAVTAPAPGAPAVTPSLPSEVNDLLSQIKAEDGRQKYSDAVAAIKALQHSQNHIKQLENEMAAAREELAKRKAAEELLEQIKNTNQPPATQVPELDVSKLENIVVQTLKKQTQETEARQNISTVVSSMQEAFGDKAEEMFKKVAVDNGLSIQYLNSLAATSPKAVLKLVGIDGKKKSEIPTKPTSTINTAALPNTPQNHGSLKVPPGAKTKDLVQTWRAVGEAIKSN